MRASELDTGDSDSDEDLESGKRGHRKRSHGSSNSAGTSPTSGSGPSAADKVKADAKAAEVEAEKKKRHTLAQAAKLNSLEQSVPADAELPAERVEMFFDGLEGAPLGIITLEDVLEEWRFWREVDEDPNRHQSRVCC